MIYCRSVESTVRRHLWHSAHVFISKQGTPGNGFIVYYAETYVQFTDWYLELSITVHTFPKVQEASNSRNVNSVSYCSCIVFLRARTLIKRSLGNNYSKILVKSTVLEHHRLPTLLSTTAVKYKACPFFIENSVSIWGYLYLQMIGYFLTFEDTGS